MFSKNPLIDNRRNKNHFLTKIYVCTFWVIIIFSRLIARCFRVWAFAFEIPMIFAVSFIESPFKQCNFINRVSLGAIFFNPCSRRRDCSAFSSILRGSLSDSWRSSMTSIETTSFWWASASDRFLTWSRTVRTVISRIQDVRLHPFFPLYWASFLHFFSKSFTKTMLCRSSISIWQQGMVLFLNVYCTVLYTKSEKRLTKFSLASLSPETHWAIISWSVMIFMAKLYGNLLRSL